MNPFPAPQRILYSALLLMVCACSAPANDAPFPHQGAESARDPVDGWSCTTTGGNTQLSPQKRYYATSFGCWLDDNGKHRGDGADNCIPYCIDSVCDGKAGRDCEESIKWFTAGERRYGCGTRLRATNPANGKSVVVMVIDRGPRCSIEEQVDHWAADLSYPATLYLFGEPMGVKDNALIILDPVNASTPLGPSAGPPESKTDDPQQNQGGSGGDSAGGAPGAGGSAGATDACGAITWEGDCSGDTLQWCENGQVKTLECASSGASCGYNSAQGYYDCVQASGGGGSGGDTDTGCGNVTAEGQCSGSTLEYCSNGSLVQADCSTQGKQCGWDAANGYYDCTAAADDGCGGVDAAGTCEGDVLKYCSGSDLTTVDCTQSGLSCGWNSGASYYDCL
jgi:hypothetical protein